MEILEKLQKTGTKKDKLESSLVKPKSEFGQTKKLLKEDWIEFNK